MKKKSIRLTLRPHEKLFLNGAVIQVERRSTIELLNDATFLLESHVLQADETDTPLKQLYFAAQIMLIDPVNAAQARGLVLETLENLLRRVNDKTLLSGLYDCVDMMKDNRIFDMLKIIRGFYPREAEILGNPLPVKKCPAEKNEEKSVHDNNIPA